VALVDETGTTVETREADSAGAAAEVAASINAG
jgi:hypothetical protein